MPKSSYKIPASITRSRLDHEITIAAFDMKSKPLPMKVILYWIGFAFVLAYLVLQSPISKAPWPALVMFSLWAFAAAAFYGGRSKTGEMKFMQVPALVKYAPKRNRQVMTRRGSNPYGFMTITGIKDVEDSGIIHCLDGWVGQMYSIVGSASLLLFENDRNRIVNRVDSFWKKVGTEAEWIFITTKEPQRVYQQMAKVEMQNRALEHRHPELRELMAEKVEILRDDVGGKYSSIHQYLMIKAPNMKALEAAHAHLQAEREGSSLMFRRCEMLRREDALEVLSGIYRAPEATKKGVL